MTAPAPILNPYEREALLSLCDRRYRPSKNRPLPCKKAE